MEKCHSELRRFRHQKQQREDSPVLIYRRSVENRPVLVLRLHDNRPASICSKIENIAPYRSSATVSSITFAKDASSGAAPGDGLRQRPKNLHNSGHFYVQWPRRRMLEQSTGMPPSIVADQAKPIGKADHKRKPKSARPGTARHLDRRPLG